MPQRHSGARLVQVITRAASHHETHAPVMQGDVRVLIAGGGVGALEAALALRALSPEGIRVEIHSPRDDFVYRPYSVTAPFPDPRDLRLDMDLLARHCGAHFHRGSIVAVDPIRRMARTEYYGVVPFDYLIVACGTRMLQGVPGAINFWGIGDDPRIHATIREMKRGRLRRVAFTMPGGNSWTLPMYELALLAQSELARDGHDTCEPLIVTPEEAPLRLFGVEACRKVAELLEARRIRVVTGATPIRFESGKLTVAPGPAVEADAVISLARLKGREIEGIPHDRSGFVPVDDHCRIRGLSRVYAVGDVTDFPVKQGGIAAQQADVAAESIVASIRGEASSASFHPLLRGVLYTGEAPLYLSGYLTGGHGEGSTAGEESMWDGSAGEKIVAKYLTPFLRMETGEQFSGTVS